MNRYNGLFFRLTVLAIGTAAFCAAIVLTLSACGKVMADASQSSGETATQQTIQNPVTASSKSEADDGYDMIGVPQLVISDSMMYRGTVLSIDSLPDSDAEILLLTLMSVDGTGFSPSTLPVAITEETKLSFEKQKLEKGAYLEVYYGANPKEKQQYAKAIAVNLLIPAERSVFNGELVEIIENSEDKDKISLLLEPLDEGMETVFHISDKTQLYIKLEELKKGDKINIYYNGIATFSIPPQSTAMEIRPYTALVSEK